MSTFGSGKTALLYLLLGWSGWAPIPGDGKPPVVENSAQLEADKAKSIPMKSEKRDIAPFTAVRIRGASNVMITGQAPRSLEIQADEASMAEVSTEVQGDTLVISRKPGRSPRPPVRVLVAAPGLQSVAQAGSGEVRLDRIKSPDLNLLLSGSGTLLAEGETAALTARLSGSGDMDLKGLRATTACVTISGSGSARVYAATELSAILSGSGDLAYFGTPERIMKRVTGSGAVSRK